MHDRPLVHDAATARLARMTVHVGRIELQAHVLLCSCGVGVAPVVDPTLPVDKRIRSSIRSNVHAASEYIVHHRCSRRCVTSSRPTTR